MASRLEGGFSDLVLVDPLTGATEALTRDRALDAEPSWVDDRTLIFRSDREANSFRLFLIGRDGSGLRGLAPSTENAFAPEVDPATEHGLLCPLLGEGVTTWRAFRSRREMRRAFLSTLFRATKDETARVRGSGPTVSILALASADVRSSLRGVVSDEWRFGLATAASDPLFRTAYGVAGSWGTKASRPNLLGYLRYDRFTPTFTALVRTESSPETTGRRDETEARVSVDFPLERKTLRTQTLGLTLRRRREETSGERSTAGFSPWPGGSTPPARIPCPSPDRMGCGSGWRITRELRALGSDLDFGKVIVDARAYKRLGPTVVAWRMGGGWTFGPRRTAEGLWGRRPARVRPCSIRSVTSPRFFAGTSAPTARTRPASERRSPSGISSGAFRSDIPREGLRAFPAFLRHMRLSASLDGAAVSTTPPEPQIPPASALPWGLEPTFFSVTGFR